MPVERVQVAKASEAPRSGSIKAFTFSGEGDDALQVLVSNVGGKLYATSAKCTHYGAPLANGVLTGDGKLICPWHGACFDAKTGDIEDSPALDSLMSFKLDTDQDGNIFVEADAEKLKGKPGVPISCNKSAQNSKAKGTVIIGGGSAAINCAESARKSGYNDPITIYTAEPHAPIDRTKLSKALIKDAEPVTWRSVSHLKNVLNVDLKQNVSGSSVDVKAKKATFSDGQTVEFDNLIIATGGIANRPPFPGAKEGDLKNVFTLRGLGDTSQIVAACGEKKDKKVAIIGTSFIGMESAIALSSQKLAKSIAVIGMDAFPFAKILGEEVGEGVMKAQQRINGPNGLEFHNSVTVEKIEGKDGYPTGVVVKEADSEKRHTIPADIVVLGIGAHPATDFLKNSPGFPELCKDGSIAVDGSLRVKGLPKESNVFACGDIATVPARSEDTTVRIEHWNVAGNHGRAVGQTIAGQSTEKPFNKLPIFWSALGAQLRYVSDGNPPGFDDVYVSGNVEDLKFAAYYAKKGKVTALATMGVDPLVMHSSVLMAEGKMPSLADIKGGKDPLSIPLVSSSL